MWWAAPPTLLSRIGDGMVLFLLGGAFAAIPIARGADLVWNNGAGTELWNATDTNWSGAAWIHSPSSNAFFSTVGGTVGLGEPVTAGAVTLGGTGYNAPSTTLIGGSLSAASLTIQGRAINNGNYPANPTLTLAVPTVSITGNIAVGRANLVVSSGTVTADRITSAAASADWARLVISGGTVTATNGIDGSTHGSVTFAIDLNGGTLRAPSIRVADREFGIHNDAWLTFNGGTLKPTADNPHFITLYGGSQNAYIGTGGAVIDTDGHDIGIQANLRASGDGGLTKAGPGTLTLSGQNSYLGTTRVEAGVLSIATPSALPPAGLVEIASGAILHLNYPGNIPIRSLRLNGVTLPEGVYGAATHPASFTGSGQLVVPPPFSNALAGASSDGISNFRRMKYGLFVHYVWGGSAYTVTVNADGSKPAGLDDLANRLNAPRFAEDMARMQVEYVVFTAWHANINCLWPSAAMDRWLTGHTTQRDMLGDMIDAVKARGIRVLLYTHPRDGHDLSQPDQVATGWGGPGSGADPNWNLFDRRKWNDFINEIYGELVDRYGSRIDGLYLDEGSAAGDSYRVVDYPRLRQTIKSRNPDLLMIQNNYGNLYSCDVGDQEIYGGHYGGPYDAASNPNTWPASANPMSMVMGSIFWASQPAGNWVVPYNPSAMFRMTVLRASVNSNTGGGVKWAAGPYAGGGWETGVLSTMEQVGALIQPVRRSICNTLPSQSWITPANASINSLANGIVATRSPDDGTEFIHVLTPPATNSITLPAPADGRGYASASLLASGHPVTLVRNPNASLTLTLQAGDVWDANNTVIALTPVTVTWNGNGNDAGPGTAAWSDSVDHFTGGLPVSTRFRPGDNVDFSFPGAPTAIPWTSNFAVGDLRFAGKDHQIQPSGTPTLTLAGGRIDVADGITASFEETGPGGPLKLAGNSGLTKTGGGTLELDLPSQVTGSTVLKSGVVAVRSGALGGGGSIVFNGGTLRLLDGNTDDLSGRIRHSQAPVKIDTAGNDVVWATPLQASNTGGLLKLGSGTLSLIGGATDASRQVTIESGALKLLPASTGGVTVPNPGFETPAYLPNAWTYNPAGTGWTFSTSAGTASNNSPWVRTSPEGVQVAFLQNNGTMSAEVTASADGHYRLSFLAANRPDYPATGLVVMLDGVRLVVYQPGQIGSGGDFNRFELPAVRITAGTHTLVFQAQQNGPDSDTIIDDIGFTGAEAGALSNGTNLALTGSGSIFDPGPSTVTLESLGGVVGSSVHLDGTSLLISGNDHEATFAGTLEGSGSVTVNGTLRIVGDAALSFTGAFTNNGILDLMTWKGTLPTGFINNGIVLDRSKVRVSSILQSGNSFTVKIAGYTGHNYQLQRSDDLSGPWQNLGSPQPGAGAELIFTDPADLASPHRFYRIAVSP